MRRSIGVILAAAALGLGCGELFANGGAASEPGPDATCAAVCGKALACANVRSDADQADCVAGCSSSAADAERLAVLAALPCEELLPALGVTAPPATAAPSAPPPAPSATPRAL